MFYRLSVTVISPELARDLNLSAVQLGSLSAAFFYAFAVMQLPLGLALDSIGARAVMTVLSAVGILGAVTSPWPRRPARPSGRASSWESG